MNTVEPIKEQSKIEELKSILKVNSYRDYFMFVLGINSGLAITDMLPLRVIDVKGKEFITIGNGKMYPVWKALKSEINSYIKGMGDNDFLFPSKKGGHIERVRAYEILREAGIKAGIKNIGTITLRKTFGYHYYRLYKDINWLQKIFGHAAPSITYKFIGIENNNNKIDFKL